LASGAKFDYADGGLARLIKAAADSGVAVLTADKGSAAGGELPKRPARRK
jgi:hypothetical protein